MARPFSPCFRNPHWIKCLDSITDGLRNPRGPFLLHEEGEPVPRDLADRSREPTGPPFPSFLPALLRSHCGLAARAKRSPASATVSMAGRSSNGPRKVPSVLALLQREASRRTSGRASSSAKVKAQLRLQILSRVAAARDALHVCAERAGFLHTKITSCYGLTILNPGQKCLVSFPPGRLLHPGRGRRSGCGRWAGPTKSDARKPYDSGGRSPVINASLRQRRNYLSAQRLGSRPLDSQPGTSPHVSDPSRPSASRNGS
jgi:hypothetical protein